ncbi:hypothetical protein [Megalodesulfovibrio paquesii]
MQQLMEKLGSRKLWTALLGSLFLLGARALDLQVSEDQLYAAAGVLMSYVLGQGMVDAKAVQGVTVVKDGGKDSGTVANLNG